MIASCPHLASNFELGGGDARDQATPSCRRRARREHSGSQRSRQPRRLRAAVAAAAEDRVNQGGVLALPSNVGTDFTANAATIPTMARLATLASRVQRLAHSPPAARTSPPSSPRRHRRRGRRRDRHRAGCRRTSSIRRRHASASARRRDAARRRRRRRRSTRPSSTMTRHAQSLGWSFELECFL